MKCSEIMVKEALFQVKAVGAEVELVSTVNMKISHCRGCGVCSQKRDAGEQIQQ